jgi:hypothetical protein
VKVLKALGTGILRAFVLLAYGLRFRFVAVGFYPHIYRLAIQQHATANFDRALVPKPIKIAVEPMYQHAPRDGGRLLG